VHTPFKNSTKEVIFSGHAVQDQNGCSGCSAWTKYSPFFWKRKISTKWYIFYYF